MQLWSPLSEAASVGATICSVAELCKGIKCLSAVKLNKRTEADPLFARLYPGYILNVASSVILLARLQRVCSSKGMPALHAVCGTSVKQAKMLSAYIMGTCPYYVEA